MGRLYHAGVDEKTLSTFKAKPNPKPRLYRPSRPILALALALALALTLFLVHNWHGQPSPSPSPSFKGLLLAQKGQHALLGANVDLFEHGLQTASRALRGGEDAETVVVSLLHDVFETVVAKNHGGLTVILTVTWF